MRQQRQRKRQLIIIIDCLWHFISYEPRAFQTCSCYCNLTLGFWRCLFQKEKERHQRVQHRKKPPLAISNSEAVRTSPRVQRHPRTSQSNTPEKSASESDAEKGTGTSQNTPPGGRPENEPQPSPLMHMCDQKEEGAADVMIISDTDSHSPESHLSLIHI